jgi:CHASE2 domain
VGLREAFSGFPRRWLIHWLTCVLVTLLFSLSLKFFDNNALFRTLDRAGADAVVKVYEPSGKENVRVLLIDLGPQPTVGVVAETLDKIRSLDTRPKAMGLDFLLVNDPAPDVPLRSLVEALSGDAPIAMPIINERLAQAVSTIAQVREASVDFTHDEDGVVRTVQERVCTWSHDGRVTLPSLAAAMVQKVPLEKEPGCAVGGEARPLLFAPVCVPLRRECSGIYLVSKEMLSEYAELLESSYVILGDVGFGSTADSFETPQGQRPGALIQAEAVWTLARGGDHAIWWSRVLGADAIDITTGLLAGGFFAAFAAASAKWANRPIDSAFTALGRFGLGVAGLLWMAAVLFCASLVWIWFAGTFLIHTGVVIGAMVAVFAAMLETLVHVGDYLIAPIHWAVTRVIQHVMIIGMIGLISSSISPSRADECSYRLKIQGQMADVNSEPPLCKVTGRCSPFDRIVVKGVGTSVTVEPEQGATEEAIHLVGSNVSSDTVLVLPPCPPPRSAFTRAWRSFWASLNPRDLTTSSGATLLYRGADSVAEIVQGGPLRELTNISPAIGTVVGSEGLAVVWAGGRPPYQVVFQDDGSGSLLGRANTSRQYLWLPGWRAPAKPFTMLVRDDAGAAVQHDLRPMPPAPVADETLADAIQLFETAPDYRMEALRRLVARAEAGDDLAERAVALIRVDGAAL